MRAHERRPCKGGVHNAAGKRTFDFIVANGLKPARQAENAIAVAEAIIRRPVQPPRPAPPLFDAYQVEQILNKLRAMFDSPPDKELLRLFQAFETGYTFRNLPARDGRL